MNRYDILAIVAMIAVPLAPAFFFGHAVYTAVLALLTPAWIAIVIGTVAALGLELVGILAGHVANTAWRVGDYGRAVVGGLVMGVYVIIGVVELWGSIGAVMFLIAPLVYLLAALQEGLKTAVNERAEETAVQKTFDLQQAAADKELDRRIRLERERAKTAARYQPKTRQDARRDTGNLPTDWRQLTRQQRRDLAHLTREERENIMPEMAERTRREWHSRLDDIAVQNGNY